VKIRISILTAVCWTCASALAGGSARPETNLFGFKGPETFPIDNFISDLRAADLDGDGLNDLIVVNNSRSKITLLYNQTGKTNSPAAVRKRVKPELNELPPDSRFRIESIASEKRIAGLVVTDLNGDKRPDLAYYGEPKELVVQYNQGSNSWSNPKRWPIDDGQVTPNALTSGDLNGDGLTDLVLLGDNVVYWLAQTKDHLLAEPERIPYSGAVKSVQVLDVNGDGRDDLLLVNWESPNPFRFRLQNEAGQLGPEMHFALPPIRSYWADDLDGDSKTEVITIAQNSGRAQISNFVRKQAEPLVGGFRAGQFSVLPLIKTSKAKRGETWADINGDGLMDLLVADPDGGQLVVYLQKKDGSLAESKSFPTLTGVSEIGVSRNGKETEIYVLSPDERQVAVSRYDGKGRIPFPTALALEGRPLAMSLLQEGPKATLAVILDRDGKRVLHVQGADGSVRTHLLSESFKSNPTTLAWHDVNQDGLADLVVLIPYEKIKLLIQSAGRDFEETDVSPPGGSVEQPWLSTADVDGDGKSELLLAQRNFVRAVVAKPEEKGNNDTTNRTWSFTVKDQISGASGTSRIIAAAPLRNATNKVASLFLLDAERKALTLCQRDTNGVWQVVRNVPLPFTEFNALQPLALGAKSENGDAVTPRPAGIENSVGFLGVNAVGWMALSGDIWELKELDGYETPIKDGHLHDVVSGDLDQDKRKDLVFLETGKNYLDLVIFDKNNKLVPTTRWQVFEERTFRGRRGEQPEPREALIVDVTGDKKNDLVVIVHDRVLMYPQE
jgi:hypothetical protein